MSTTTKFMSHFCGQEISRYGREHGSVDYAALARSFDAVLCNEIVNTHLWEDAELVSARPDHSERLEEIADRLEELERLTADKESDKEDLEEDRDIIDENITDAYNAIDKINDALHYIDEAGDIIDGLPYYEGADSCDIRSEVERASDDLTDYTTEQEERRDELGEKLEKLEKELEKLEKEQNELESEQEELEAEQDYIAEVFQWYIISDEGAHILEQYLPYEVMYYVPALDVYVWGVCHFGTSWAYVLTGIPCETYEEQEAREEQEREEQERRNPHYYDTVAGRAVTDDESRAARVDLIEALARCANDVGRNTTIADLMRILQESIDRADGQTADEAIALEQTAEELDKSR